MPTGDLLHSGIWRKLSALRTSLRRRLAGEGVAWLVVALVALVFVTLAFDYFLWLDRLQRGLIMGACLAGVLWVVWRQLLRPLLVPMPRDDLALLVEDRYGLLGDRLISAVEFSRPGAWDPRLTSQAMIERMADQANRLAAPLDFQKVVEHHDLWRAVGVAACCAMLLGGFSIWQRDVMALWFQRNVLIWSDAEWPQKTVLKVEGGPDFIVVRGKDLGVTVSVEPGKEVPDSIVVHARYPSIAGATEDKIQRADADSRTFVKVFRAVGEPFEFYVTGGDDTRDKRRPHKVRVLDPPVLRNVSFTIYCPGYMKQNEPRTYDDSPGTINVPGGSTVHVAADCTKPVRAAEVFLDDQPTGTVSFRKPGDSSDGQTRTLSARFQIEGQIDPRAKAGRALTRELRLSVTDTDGITNPTAGKYLVQVLPDQDPKVSLRKQGVGGNVTPMATLPLLVHAADDNGLASLAAQVQVVPKKDKPIPAPIAIAQANAKEVRLRHELELAERFPPGTVIQVSVEAADNFPPNWGGPNRGTSGVLDFRVVRTDELMAELVRRQKQLRLEFVQTITEQTSSRAKVLSAVQASSGAAVPPDAQQELVAAAGLQTSVGSECARAAMDLQDVLDELTNNKLSTADARRQLAETVIGPLQDLAKPVQDVVDALRSIAKLQDTSAFRQQAGVTAQAQEKILEELKAIRDRMQKLESRQELAYQLEMIIKLWNSKVLKTAEKASETEVGNVLGPGTRKSDTQPSGEKPKE